ncbi:DNA adenine methylase [Patescibacteria group bacterium]
MRFIGNKEKLLENIYEVICSTEIKDGVFCDFFSGTSNVGRYFKEKGFQVISSDVLYFSYVLQKAYIKNNKEPDFSKLSKTITIPRTTLFISPLDKMREYLNSLKGVSGFIYKNYTPEGTNKQEYPRKYFTGNNGKKIDAIRIQIEKWNEQKLISKNEYFVLLAMLVESVPFYANISGVYAAFLKNYDPRATKKFELKPIKIYAGNKKHWVYNQDSMHLLDNLETDVLYIDPPYNSRQYGGNYHLLETVAKYDNPEIKGVTGMRNYSHQKSEFCNVKTAIEALDKIALSAKYKTLVLSYNSEGIMPQKEIMKTLKKYGDVKLKEIDYLRFKSNSNGDSQHKKRIREQLYLLSRQ